MSKSKQQQAEEKANQQTVSAQIPDKGKYPPGTIGSEKNSVSQEIVQELEQNLLLGVRSEALQFAVYVSNAFMYGASLAIASHLANDNQRYSFIANYLRLELYFERAKKIADTKESILKDWPQNAGITFGLDSGFSALEVEYKFSQRMLNAILTAGREALGGEPNQFDYLSIDDPRIDKWREVFRKRREGTALPSSEQWPAWQIYKDGTAIVSMLGDEIAHVFVKQPTVASGKAETKTELVDKKKTTYSTDFRSVRWFGTNYSFTPNQAAAVKILWENWEKGTPDVGGDTLAVEIESDSKRPRDIFKGHPAFGTMIRPGKTKGTYRLAEPDK